LRCLGEDVPALPTDNVATTTAVVFAAQDETTLDDLGTANAGVGGAIRYPPLL